MPTDTLPVDAVKVAREACALEEERIGMPGRPFREGKRDHSAPMIWATAGARAMAEALNAQTVTAAQMASDTQALLHASLASAPEAIAPHLAAAGEVEPAAWMIHDTEINYRSVTQDRKWAEAAEGPGYVVTPLYAATPPATPAQDVGAAHPDDLAVDRFAIAMKSKLAKKRAEGYSGWDNTRQCSRGFLSKLLRSHVEKGDPVDVGNLAMMLHQRGERIEK